MTIEQAQELAEKVRKVVTMKVKIHEDKDYDNLSRIEVHVGKNVLYSCDIKKLEKMVANEPHFITIQDDELLFIIC